jgi:hypothetical protein
VTVPWVDRRNLREVQYRDDANLAARPGGRVLVVLNAADHLAELRAHLGTPGERLTLDGGEALLVAEFGTVTRHEVTAELRLPDATPLEAYARSMLTTPPVLPAGPLRIRTHTGCLVCA